MRVLGIDPGKTTGIYLIDEGRVSGREIRGLLSLWTALHQVKPDKMIVEAFLGRSPHVDPAPSLKAIGVCEMYAEEAGIDIVMSNPSELQGKSKPRGLSPHIWSAKVHAEAYIRRLYEGPVKSLQ